MSPVDVSNAAIPLVMPEGQKLEAGIQYADGKSGNLRYNVVGSTRAAHVDIPIEAIQDRRAVYGLAACEMHAGPGAYCTGTPFCTSCQSAVQKCIDEHVEAGRL